MKSSLFLNHRARGIVGGEETKAEAGEVLKGQITKILGTKLCNLDLNIKCIESLEQSKKEGHVIRSAFLNCHENLCLQIRLVFMDS